MISGIFKSGLFVYIVYLNDAVLPIPNPTTTTTTTTVDRGSWFAEKLLSWTTSHHFTLSFASIIVL